MIQILGFDPTQVDSTAKHPLGLEVHSVVSGHGTETVVRNTNGIGTTGTSETKYLESHKKYRYVRADAAIAQYDACMLKLGESDDPYAVVKTGAATDWCEGICEVSGVDADEYFWLTIYGYVPIANVADASAEGDWVTPSATAGRLDSTAIAAGDKRIRAISDGDANNRAAVFLY